MDAAFDWMLLTRAKSVGAQALRADRAGPGEEGAGLGIVAAHGMLIERVIAEKHDKAPRTGGLSERCCI
jgi:hypothetical protein